MRKIAVFAAIVAIAALAAPAFSQTNPFMDVPMNHWAYDAIGQLAAHGILSGYPDGLYKGKQQTTRYEMASALARALAVVDMTKASKQDVEMLKRLVVEFKDELEALGVRVDELDERVALLESRLGGWHIHGVLALDLTYEKAKNAPDPDGSIKFDDSKLYFERFWGEDDQFHFVGRLNGGDFGNAANFDRFFVEMPFFFDSRFTVGRWNWAWEGAYKVSNNIGNVETGGWDGDQLMTDWAFTGFGVSKNFALGNVNFAVAHPDGLNGRNVAGMNTNTRATLPAGYDGGFVDTTYNNWMLLLGANFQFTEQLGLDIGGQMFIGDNAEQAAPAPANSWAFDKMWTIWGGLRFDFNENIGFKGVFYHQDRKMNQVNGTGTAWVGYDENPNHWAVMLDVKQPALKYTSVWLEYGQYDRFFTTRSGNTISYAPTFDFYFAPADIKYWRVALGQEWNEKWATHIFYYGYKVDRVGGDWKPAEYGLGVQYKLNDYTTMGLNYVHVNVDDMLNDNDNVVRFRTKVTF